MRTIRLTTAQAILKFLDNQYINVDGCENKFFKGVMGIFGHGNVVGLGQGLEQSKDGLIYYQGKNEQEIAHAAMAYAKQKNRKETFACTASIGPGSLNFVTAAATATVNKIPVLFLPSDSYACRQPDPVLQQVENPQDYSITTSDSFKAVSRYWDRIVRPEQLMTSAINAMRVLTDPAETGAVTISLPQDVQGEAYDYPVEFFNKRVHYIERRILPYDTAERVAELISKKKKPLLICGGGVRYSGAGQALVDFAESFNIPFSETQAGKGTIPWNHEYNLGGGGVCGTLAANKIAKEADLIIAVGTKLNDFVTSSKYAYRNPDCTIVTINVSSFDAIKMESVPVVADAKEGLSKLREVLLKKGYKSGYTSEITDVKKEWNEELDRLGKIELEGGLSQTRVLLEINKLLDDNAIVVSASGSLPSDLERLWKPVVADTYHLEYGFSCMGYEVPGALGAKIAEPNREVYAVLGDGGYLMGHTELYTSIQEGIKINILLFDNNGHQCIHNLQRSQGVDSFATEFRTREASTGRLTGKYAPIDFAANARSYGAKAYTVTTLEELKVAIELSKKDAVSTLIEIKVLPETMTEGYESWWRVGTAAVSETKKGKKAYEDMQEVINKVRVY
ncbi:MAG: 3D-(3,5/4)-trihydroxycyclohexane-1,2-dione acylhydrolase (decyclizing) [Clostridium sp.]|jgi:3D-(3,5/4)-trihydroxycyclohexane-1,2-dione acylhydrolase (decyclizing)